MKRHTDNIVIICISAMLLIVVIALLKIASDPLLVLHGGELEYINYSPDGRWEIRLYSYDHEDLVEAVDLSHGGMTRNIYSGEVQRYPFVWKNSNVVMIDGRPIDVRQGKTSIYERFYRRSGENP